MSEDGEWSADSRKRATSVLNYDDPSEHVLNKLHNDGLTMGEEHLHEAHHEEALLFDAHHAEEQAKADAGDATAKAFVQAEEEAMGKATADIDKQLSDVEKLLAQLKEAGIDLTAMQKKHDDLT